MYLPYGRYSSNMITAPLTLSLGRINDRAALLGYYKDGFMPRFTLIRVLTPMRLTRYFMPVA